MFLSQKQLVCGFILSCWCISPLQRLKRFNFLGEGWEVFGEFNCADDTTQGILLFYRTAKITCIV